MRQNVARLGSIVNKFTLASSATHLLHFTAAASVNGAIARNPPTRHNVLLASCRSHFSSSSPLAVIKSAHELLPRPTSWPPPGPGGALVCFNGHAGSYKCGGRRVERGHLGGSSSYEVGVAMEVVCERHPIGRRDGVAASLLFQTYPLHVGDMGLRGTVKGREAANVVFVDASRLTDLTLVGAEISMAFSLTSVSGDLPRFSRIQARRLPSSIPGPVIARFPKRVRLSILIR